MKSEGITCITGGRQIQNQKKWLLAFVYLLFFTSPVTSQTHVQLILNTDKVIDSALIVHWTDREMIWLPFKDTLEVNFKTRGIDFYHLN